MNDRSDLLCMLGEEPDRAWVHSGCALYGVPTEIEAPLNPKPKTLTQNPRL